MTTYDVINPTTEKIVESVQLADAEQTDAAITRAANAAAAWMAVAPVDRARLVRRFAEEVDADLEHLAQLEVANAGHTIGNARWEAGNVRDVLHYYAAAPERLIGQQIPVAGGLDVTFHEPLGVVGVIVPWNFPMPIAGWGFAPGLAAGSTVVLKPRRADSVDRDPAGRAGAARRPFPRTCSPSCPAGDPSSVSGS
ncbi:MAG TPA: aldehyde dehydrogenase family protein [Jiangellaceae bacterium]|nr:aldehyde dehydrogenase family protein [Jiangellaceae bacterium]